MATLRISGFPVGISLQPALTVNGTEKIPVDQTVSGVLQTVNATIAQLLGGATAINYTNGLVTIGPPLTPGNAENITGNSGVAFLGNTKLGLRVNGATSTTDYSGIDFTTTNTNPQARIAAVMAAGGSSLVLGTSNNYTTGITNNALTIDPNSNVTIGGGAVTGGLTTTISNTSGADGDISRIQVSTSTSAVALYAAPTTQSTAIVTGGPVGAQSVLRNLGNYPIVFGTSNIMRGFVNGAGNWALSAPTSGNTLQVTALATQRAIQVVGSGSGIALAITTGTTLGLYLDNTAQGAGTPALRIDVSATTGAATPTLGAVKPGANTAASQWLPISINGTTMYIPCWL